ncbi:MAG: hypothetical protein K0S33_868 [Bacteroidetes bacterium]|jgi:hypothetical protein|nr:hypothetical protein [Bacteroidota bacterium]
MHSMSVPNKIIKAKTIRAALQANATVFPGAAALITSLTAAITALETSWTNAEDGGKSLKAMMRQREREFDQVMQLVANYVESTANGNPAIIILSTLDVAQANPGTQTQSFKVKQGESGTVLLRTKSEKGAAYTWEYSVDNINWIHAGSGIKSSLLAENLVPGPATGSA